MRRGAIGAIHTLFSVGTTASANGRWDLTIDGSQNITLTRVTSGGASTNSITAGGLGTAAIHLITLVFDGTTPTIYVDRASAALTGTAAGNIGTASYVAVGCRASNTSTYDQFATAEIPEVMAWDTAFSSGQLVTLHAWAKRRYGV